jgi:cell division protein FtsQ
VPVRHPLLRARRVAVARATGRRRLRVLLIVLALGALGGGVLALLHSPVLAARHVQVLGAVHTPRSEVLAVTGLGADPPLVDVQLGADAAALRRLPWVATARVSRDWPDGITVQILERRPAATIALAGGRYLLADSSGRVLAITMQRPAGLLELAAPSGSARPGAQLPSPDLPLLATAARLPASLHQVVASVLNRPGEGVELRLVGGQLVVLGTPANLPEQAVALATLLAKVPLHGIATIDLRVPDAPVLTP